MTTVVVDECVEACTSEQFQRLLNFNRHVVHDLRAPLVSVVGAVEQAQAALAMGDTAAASRLLHLLSSRASGMAQLISELLLLSTARDAPLAMATVELGAIAQDAVDDVLRHAQPQLVPRIELGPLPRVTGSGVLLKQVFVNLVGNALKFSRKTVRPCIEIGMAAGPGKPAALFVQDNGIGFAGCDTNRLFEPFSRLHGGGEYPGHGLGLNIVRCIVERHGGRVWAESSVHGGAALRFTLGGLSGQPR